MLDLVDKGLKTASYGFVKNWRKLCWRSWRKIQQCFRNRESQDTELSRTNRRNMELRSAITAIKKNSLKVFTWINDKTKKIENLKIPWGKLPTRKHRIMENDLGLREPYQAYDIHMQVLQSRQEIKAKGIMAPNFPNLILFFFKKAFIWRSRELSEPQAG